MKSNQELVCETYKKVSRECGALESIQPVQFVYLIAFRMKISFQNTQQIHKQILKKYNYVQQ